jgi:hypothetical protein
MSARGHTGIAIAVSLAIGIAVGVYAWRVSPHGRSGVTRTVERAPAPARRTPRTVALGRQLPPERPVWRVDGREEEVAKIVMEPSPQQWARRLRDEVCACRDAVCATRAQQRFAHNIGTLDFSSGSRDETDGLIREVGTCTTRLLDAANSPS